MVLTRVHILLWLYYGISVFIYVNANNCSCYMFFASRNKSWTGSQRECSTNDGSLVSMETEGEWKFINNKVQERNFGDNEWWIGLKNQNGQWKWTSNWLLTILKWQRNVQEPNGDGKCAAMAKNFPTGYQGLFKDMRCLTPKRFICEYEKTKAICEHVDSSYIYCTHKRIYEVSNPVYTRNVTKTDIVSPTNATLSPNSTSKIGIIIFLSMFGIILLVCTVVFIYVFCLWVYQPGYQGYGRENRKNLGESTPLAESPSGSESYSKSQTVSRFYVDIEHNVEVARTEESWDSSGSDIHVPESTELDSHIAENQDSETKDETIPVIYAQVHKSLSKTPLMEQDGLSGKNSFEMKTIETDHTEKEDARPEISKKPPKDAVVYASLQSIMPKPHVQPRTVISEDNARHRSNTACTKFTLDENNVSMETNPTPLRKKTWNSRSRWYDVEDQGENSCNDVTSEVKGDPQSNAKVVAADSSVIYAKVDKSKKTKNKQLEKE